MTNDSFDAERTVVAVWEILARAIVAESGPDQDYLNELAAVLQPGKAQTVLSEAQAVLVRWNNHDSGETDREFLDELLVLLSGPRAIAVAKDYIAGQSYPPIDDAPPVSIAAPAPAQPTVTPRLVGHSISEVERSLIIDTLKEVDGNRTLAATVLGISLRTLRNKLHQYADEGVEIPRRGVRRWAR